MNTRKEGSLQQVKREGFATSIGVVAATLGSAVGLGNLWKFPTMTGQNGGAAFLFLYLICVILVGLPVLLSEWIIGRRASSAIVTAFKKLEPKQPWYFTGYAGVTSAFLIMFFYTAVAGWVYAYIFKSIIGAFTVMNPLSAQSHFVQFAAGASPIFWQWLVIAGITAVIIAGVTKGIERVTKILLPILFILLLVCDIRALTLPGAAAGISFLFKPDFSQITGAVVLAALGLAFFKLSLGLGTMTTYGSYIGKNENLPRTALKIVLADMLVSLMAGLAIFPTVFTYNFEPSMGPPLLFVTIPMVFKSVPYGQFFTILFFILTEIAATGALISMLEVPVAFLVEELKWTRLQATLVSALFTATVGVTAALSPGIFSDTLIFGQTFFDLFDFASSNILLPLGGLFICLFVGWKLGKGVIIDEASNSGALHNEGILSVYTFLVKYVTPVLIVVILLAGLMNWI